MVPRLHTFDPLILIANCLWMSTAVSLKSLGACRSHSNCINLYCTSSFCKSTWENTNLAHLDCIHTMPLYNKPIPPECLKPFLQHLCASMQDQRQAEQLRSAQIPQTKVAKGIRGWEQKESEAGNKRSNVVWHYIIPPPKPMQTGQAASRDPVDLGMTRAHAMADSCWQQTSSAMSFCPSQQNERVKSALNITWTRSSTEKCTNIQEHTNILKYSCIIADIQQQWTVRCPCMCLF